MRAALIFLLVLGLLAIMQASTPLIDHYGGWDNDGVHYRDLTDRMRHGESLSGVPPPWNKRVLTPFLASLLPFDALTSYRVLAFVSNWVSLLLLYAIIRGAGLRVRDAVIGLLLYAGVFWTVKFSMHSPGYIDFQTQCFLLLGLLLIQRRFFWILPPLIALAVLQKESLLLLSAIAYIEYARKARRLGGRSLLYLATVAGVPLITLLAAYNMIPGESRPAALEFATNVLRMGNPLKWPRFVLAMFSGLGVLPFVLIAGRREATEFLKENRMWLALILIGTLLLFGGVDKSRYFLYMLPAVVVTAVWIIRGTLDGGRGRAWIWLAVTLGLHFYLGNHFEPLGTFDQYLNRLVPMHAPGSLVPAIVRITIVALVWSTATMYNGRTLRRA